MQIAASIAKPPCARAAGPAAARLPRRVASAAPAFAPRLRRVAAAASPASADPYAEKYPSWDSIFAQLRGKYDLRSVTPDEAAILLDEGKAVLLDVRLDDDYEESHPRGSLSVPAFRIIKMEDGAGLGRMVKSLLMRSNGVTPTEAHPAFPSAAAAAAGPDRAVIVACEAGGAPFATSSFPTGKASRSLKAAWRLMYAGALPPERVLHLEGGVLGWYKAGLPMEGTYDAARAGRTPNAVPLQREEP